MNLVLLLQENVFPLYPQATSAENSGKESIINKKVFQSLSCPV